MLRNLSNWMKVHRKKNRSVRRINEYVARVESLEKRSLLATIIGGNASLTLHEGNALAIAEFDAYFSSVKTRSQVLSEPAPGNAPFTESPSDPSTGIITLVDPIRPFGEAPLNDAGGTSPGGPGASRTRQATTLQIENLGNVLGSWSTSNDAFAFVGNSTLGEQIAFTSMQRWTGPFPGSLLFGDFALRNTGSKLVLASNIDFLGAAFADIGSPTISVSGNTLTIQGDLLIGGGLNLLDSSAAPGTDFGDITITATLAELPVVTDANISISGGTGTSGAFRIGDTVTATWNNTSTGDNNSGVRAVSNVTVDFTQFGGGSEIAATNNGNTWTATYTIPAGTIDAAGRNVSVTAINPAGSVTASDSTNAKLDNVAPLSVSLLRTDPNPTDADTVRYTLTFSEPVNGVDASDFALATTGVVDASILNVVPVGAGSLLANTTANGTTYLTYDRAAWATLAPYADYYDIHGNPLGSGADTADADGFRWMYPDRFEGASWPGAVYPRDFLTPVPSTPLSQPTDGFALPVNTYGVNSFAVRHKITDYNSTTRPNGYIGLAGSIRATSDFNEPGASVWWQHLALRQDPADSIWKIFVTSGAGQGSLFELRNVTTETVNGNLYLSGDYVFGNTDWLQFFQDVNGHLDTERVLGHIKLIPSGITAYEVTVGTGTGDGTIGLNLVDDDSIVDLIGNRLGGSGAGNGDANGQLYTIDKPNNVPVAQPSSVTLNEDEPYTFDVNDFTYTDVEGDALASITISGLNLSNGDTLTVDQGSGAVPVSNGLTIEAGDLPSLRYTPAANAFGSARSSFQFTVNDTDNGTVSAPMNLNVISVNDAPVFGQLTYAFSVNNRALTGATAGTVSATDPDSGASLTYSIVDGNALGAFEIETSTGKITIANPSRLPRIVAPATSVDAPALTIAVTDGDLVDTATLVVSLKLAPQAMEPLAAARATSFSVRENNVISATVASIAGRPSYTGQLLANWSVSDAPDGSASEKFYIKSFTTSGAVIGVNSRLNFEEQSSFTFYVTVSDSLDASKTVTTPITLNVADVNEAPQLSLTDGLAGVPTSSSGTPVSLVSRYTINEYTTVTAGNTPKNGDVLFTVNALDEDQSSNSLSYILTGTGVTSPSTGVYVDRTGALQFDAATGQVTVLDATKLSFETYRSGIPLAFNVSDNGLPGSLPTATPRPLTSKATVTILLSDLNEAPTFATATRSVVKAENNLANSLVVRAMATDGDTFDGVTSPLTYSLVSVLDGSGADVSSRFSIHPTTGDIRVIAAKQLDFESNANKLFSFTVRATENGSGMTTGQSIIGDQVITLSVTDVNEAPAAVFTPVNGLPSLGTAGSVTVNLPDVSVGSSIGSLSLTDPDILSALGTFGPDSLVVTVQDGSSSVEPAFSYVPNANPLTGGSLQVNDLATLETKVGRPFSVRFTVRDRGGLAGALSFTLTLTVNVTDI